LNRVWSLVAEAGLKGPGNADAERRLRRAVHQAIRRASADFEKFEFNTIISGLMELTNALQEARPALAGGAAWDEALSTLLLMMAPVTPHVAEELWERLGKPYSIHQQPWPAFDPDLAKEDEITLVIQVNGKVRDRVTVPADISEEDARRKALGSEAVQKALGGKEPRQIIVVPGRLVNVVI